MLQAKGELRDRIYNIEQMLKEAEKQAWSIPIDFDRKRMTRHFINLSVELQALKACIV